MSEKEIEIEYLGITSTVKMSPTYDKFISQLRYKFFIPDKMKKISILYHDSDGDENNLENPDDYDDFLNDAEGKIYLTVSEENENKNLNGNTDEINKKIKEKINSRNKYIEEYRKQLRENCIKTIKKLFEEVDKKHAKEIEEMKKNLGEKLKNIKEVIEKQTSELLEEIENKSSDIGNEKFVEYCKSVDALIEKIVKDKQKYLQDKINEIDFESLEKNQNEISKAVEKNKEELNK